jgi:hypothetical protein
MYSYVYKVEFPETGHVYFGSRSCECRPEEDTEYLGSPKTHKAHWEAFKPVKVILREFDNWEEANTYEAVLIEWAWSVNKSLSLNANIGGARFSTLGVKFSEEVTNKLSKHHLLVSPTGEELNILNLDKFARENNLNSASLYQVTKGDLFNYKGYTANINNHLLYLKVREDRGIRKWSNKKGAYSVSWQKNKNRQTKYFSTKEKAILFRDKLEEEGHVFKVLCQNWKNKLKEMED